MKLIDLAIQTAQKAGKFIYTERQKNFVVEKKAKNDLVTSIDKASEELIINEIRSRYPSHAFLGEESSFETGADKKNLAKADFIWIIDPIDGTTNFVHGIPHYAVSIAVFKAQKKEKSHNFDYLAGEITAAAIYAPALKELFYAEKGKGAYLNGNPLQVSKIKKIEESLAATGFPGSKREKNIPYFLKMLENCQAIRRFGAASLDLARIASGQLDIFWEFNLKPWDIAAGALLINEAGGVVSDTSGEIVDLFGGDILAGNKKIQRETVKLFSEIV